MPERLILDPACEAAEGRTELDLTPFVASQGPDFGEARVDALMADGAVGALPVDFRWPNRTVVIPLVLHACGDLSYEDVRAAVQAKAALFQREGGVLLREVNGRPLFLDVLTASLKMGGSTAQAIQEVDADAVLELETLPDWYGEETEIGSENGAGEVVFTLDHVEGDHPGRSRIVVTDQDNVVARRGVFWAVRHRHQSDDATAALAYAAEDLTPRDLAGFSTVAGSFGTQVVEHQGVSEVWAPVLSTDIDDVGPMTHVGAYRVRARVMVSSPAVRLRLVWDVGDLVWATANPVTSVPGADAWYTVDLGWVRLDRSGIGAHRWNGAIQAITTEVPGETPGAQTVAVDRVWFQAVDDYAGDVTVSTGVPQIGLTAYSARDGFDQGSGSLNGAAAYGGMWSSSGATGDFSLTAEGYAARSTSDGSGQNRVAVLGSAMAATVAQVDFYMNAPISSNDSLCGLVLRYVDADNRVDVYRNLVGNSGVWIVVRLGGSADLVVPVFDETTAGTWYRLTAHIDTDGNVRVWSGQPGAALGAPILTAQHDDLATGGALASGKVGIIDHSAGNGHLYNNFAAWVPADDAVIHPGQSVEIRTDGVYRCAADGLSGAGLPSFATCRVSRRAVPKNARRTCSSRHPAVTSRRSRIRPPTTSPSRCTTGRASCSFRRRSARDDLRRRFHDRE